jgi:hypothetical protein
VALAVGERRLRVQRVPQRPVALGHAACLVEQLVDHLVALLEPDGEVHEPAADVLLEDREVVRPLAVGERVVHLGGLGVDEVGLQHLAVALEQDVGQGAVAPEDATAVQVDDEQRDGVEQALPVPVLAERDVHEQRRYCQQPARYSVMRTASSSSGRRASPAAFTPAALGARAPAAPSTPGRPPSAAAP